LNFPLEADCGEKKYLDTLNKTLEMLDMDKFEILAVSVGFDTHTGDLASLGLTEKSYKLIGKKIATLEKQTFFILEGGYNGEKNARDIDQFLRGYEEKTN
jgi:acetoin utilization deacetylase AcuC-like enzyme